MERWSDGALEAGTEGRSPLPSFTAPTLHRSSPLAERRPRPIPTRLPRVHPRVERPRKTAGRSWVAAQVERRLDQLELDEAVAVLLEP